MIAGLVTALALAALAQPAAAGLKACKTSITACSCAAKKAKRYVLANSLVSASSSPDCLTVAHAGAVIDLAGNSISGPGGAATGAGIHILASAKRALIEGGGFNNSINGFGTGILIEASNAVVNGIGLLSNAQFGVMIDGGSNNAIYDLDAGSEGDASTGNGIAGVLINNGNGNFVDDIHAANNTKYGVEISGGSNNSLHDLDGIYGIWINGSSNNRVVNCTGTNNSQVGLYIGCAPTGGVGGTCPGAAIGSANVVKFGQYEFNPTAGIGIDVGNLANQIGLNEIGSNGAADAVDGNASCGTNLWFFDDLSMTPAQTCIK